MLNYGHTFYLILFIIPRFYLNVNIFQKIAPDLPQAEGFVLGLGAKMFTVAGPVIVYGVVASVIYGFIYWLMQVM